MGLGRSLRLIGDQTTRVVVTDLKEFPWEECFDVVMEPEKGSSYEWLFFDKLNGLRRTDADQILFIDADHLAFKRLDDIFDACAGKGLCVEGVIAKDGFWHIDLAKHIRENNLPGIPRFNGGMIYYERTPECEEFIKECYAFGARAKEFGFDRTDLPINDEIGIALAMAHTGKGHVVPDHHAFHHSATGLIGKLHMNVLTNTCRFLARHHTVRNIEPYVFHASRYKNFLVYWKQLAALERLARFEKEKPYGYMSTWQRTERSIQRRILKYVYRKV
jgi:hypothetical protein